MALEDTPSIKSYAGNGTSSADVSPTAYPLPFVFFSDDDIALYVDGVLSADTFSIIGDKFTAAATVVTDVAYTAEQDVTFQREVSYDQPTVLPGSGRTDPTTLERAYDYLSMQIQQVAREVEESPKAAPGDTTPGGSFSEAANTTVGQDANGDLVMRSAAEEVAFLGIGTSVDAAVASAAAALVSETNAATSETNAAASEANAAASEAAALDALDAIPASLSASNTFTIATNAAVGSILLTFDGGGVFWAGPGDQDEAAQGLADLINAGVHPVTATATGNILRVVAKLPGDDGNGISCVVVVGVGFGSWAGPETTGGSISNLVLTSTQSLTSTQKAQAQANIGSDVATETRVDARSRAITQAPLVQSVSPIRRGLILPMDEPIQISTNSGTQDYNAAPWLAYWKKTDELIGVWRRGSRHASGSNLDGEVMLCRSTDGTMGRAWSTPVSIIPNDGGDFRDPMIYALDDRVLVFANHFETYGTDEDGRVFIYESFDLTTFTKIGEILPTNEIVGTLADYNRAVANGDLIIAPDGEMIISGFETNLRQNSSQSFFRSVLWHSLDGGVTWALKSEIKASTFSDPADRSTILRAPNETCAIMWEGKLVAFVRDSGFNGETQKLFRVESDDFGTTWATPVDVTFTRWSQALPGIKRLPDGRLWLPHRGGLTSNVCYSISYDGGATWEETINTELEYQEYESLLIVDQDRAVSIFAQDVISGAAEPAADKKAANVSARSWDIAQSRRPNDVPPVALTDALDYTRVSYDGSLAESSYGPDWIQGDVSRAPSLIYGSTERQGLFFETAAATGVIYTGGLTDHEYLHDGSPFSLGINFFVDLPGASTPLLTTCEFSNSQTGLNVYIGSGNRLNVEVYDGAAPAAVDYQSPGTGFFDDKNWVSLVVTFDGTDYNFYLNGFLKDSFDASAVTFPTGAHFAPLSIGKAEDASLSVATDLQFARAFVTDIALTAQQVREMTLWLDK